jgi:hypothetical protein
MAAAANNRKEDAQLLYMMVLASSRLPLYHGYFAKFICSNRDGFSAVDVMRHALVSSTLGLERE